MNSDKLLTILKTISLTNFQYHGLAINYYDLFNELQYKYGFNNPDLLHYLLNYLEQSNLIENIKQSDLDENLIIGIKIK